MYRKEWIYPLSYAVRGKHLSTAKLLISLGAGKEKKYEVDWGWPKYSYEKHTGNDEKSYIIEYLQSQNVNIRERVLNISTETIHNLYKPI